MNTILNFLKTIEPPRMIREALALFGTVEQPGRGSNPILIAWAKETNTKDDNWYNDDSIPWCGLFMAVVAQRAGKEVPANDLRAKSWAKFGIETPVAMLGDVVVFTRATGGHVGLYLGESHDSYWILGGNQGDRVSIARIAKNRLFAIRRPIYAIGQPESVKQYFYDNSGALSTNEG